MQIRRSCADFTRFADGEYHWVQRRLADIWLARIVQIFMLVGQLEWLEAGK
jgi:hypothetical protein